MKKIDWMAKLSTLDGAVNERRNIHSTVIQTVSPSLNFSFSRGWGLPLGYSLILYGPPKAGKSVITYMMAAGVHRDYEDGIVVKFNTEFREEGQLDDKMAALYGVDLKRYKGIDVNSPDLIYDQIEKKLAAWCDDGMPIKLVIIDSMNGVQGLRAMGNDSITNVTIGDVAKTNKEGLKRILPLQHKHRWGLIMTSHVAIEMDPIEQKRGNKWKMGASVGVQHHGEYFMFVESSKNAADRADMLGKKMEDPTMRDMFGSKPGAAGGRAEQTAMKIRATMKDSSLGLKGRSAQFTLDFGRGIINQHEEVFLLGTRRGVIQRPNNTMYVFDGREWRGQDAMVLALKESPELQEAVLKELRERDIQGRVTHYDELDAAAIEAAQNETEAATVEE